MGAAQRDIIVSGTGRVYLAPVPNRNLLLKGMMGQIGMARAGR